MANPIQLFPASVAPTCAAFMKTMRCVGSPVEKAEIDEMLARLQDLSGDHFNTHPDEVTWGDVGSLEHYASLLRRITDSAFKEGEFAD